MTSTQIASAQEESQAVNTVRSGGGVMLGASSIAIIGASPDDNKLGGKLVRFLQRYGYRGRVYPVNQKYREVQGHPCFPSLTAIKDPVDMAVVAVPYREVLQAIWDCLQKGVKQAVVFSSGFAETGPEGAERERALKDLIRGTGMRLVGPNALGVANVADGLIANFSQSFELPDGVIKPGPVGFASQSGAFGTFIFSLAAEQGIGFKYFASTGNEIDVTITDCLAGMVADADVRMVAGYIEALRDGRRFLAVAEQARQNGKPLMLIKTGRTPGGSAAALSHTAAIAGDDEVYDAAFRQTGVIRVTDEEAMLDLLNVMRWKRSMAGRRVAVVTNSGGAGVLIADALATHGLQLAQLRPETGNALKQVVPAFGSARNPVDMTGQFLRLGDPGIEMLRRALQCLLDDPETDAVLLYLGLARRRGAKIADALRDLARTATKPLVAAWTAGPPQEIERLRNEGVPVLSSPTRSVRALAALASFTESRSRKPRSFALPRPGRGQRLKAPPGGYSEARAKAVLREWGVPVPNERLCASEEEAAAFAAQAGYPVALKVSSPGLMHKTEAGAVALAIRDKSELIAAYRSIVQRAAAHIPGLPVEGVLVTPMAEDGIELIVGGRRDPVFGPVVMVGSGGIYTEVMRDATIRVLPLLDGEAAEMLRELRIHPVLAGNRSNPPADIDSAARCIEAVARLLASHPEVEDVEINPLRVFPEGRGAWALDAVLRVSAQASKDTTEK
ncbi:MAG: acetate--CoA ligase family protein [Betaproteobacteria bacterium]|nr:acetate--CoA ligase family protein [Betaproteobacteria bacterium]